jgi:hypothetical protein
VVIKTLPLLPERARHTGVSNIVLVRTCNTLSHRNYSSLALFAFIFSLQQNAQKQLLDEDLMKDEDEGFHGSVARRFERATTGQLPTPADVNEVGGTEYAMA